MLFAFICFSVLGYSQAICTQSFTANGLDNDPTVLTINATDITCNGAGTITGLQLINGDTPGNCPGWFNFSLSVDGGAPIVGCGPDFNNTDITGFTTLTITSADTDGWAPGDAVTINIDVEVTFTPVAPPNCDAALVTPLNGATDAPIDGNITWSAASGGVTGYNLTVGTTPGGNDVLATTDVGNVTAYALGGLTASTTYYVNVVPYNGFGNATGCTEESFTTYTPVAGDDCSIAIPINCGDSASGTTVGATDSGAPGAFCGTGPGAPGVWYSFSGNGDIVTASLCGSAYDTKIQVYEGTCGGLVCVTGNDDSCGLQSEVLFASNAGTQYYIYVFGFGTSTGNYTLDITCTTPPPPPANDDCAAAIDLTVNADLNCDVVTAGTIAGATASAEANTCGGTADDDVWYTFTATANLHTVSLTNIAGSTTDLYIGVFEGGCAGLTEVLCSDNEEATVTGLTPGTTYLVRVYSWTGNPLQDSTFDICVGTPPPPITTDITTYIPEELITEVLIDGDCAVVDNIQYDSHSFDDQIGFSYFTDGGSDYPFADGVILSSGAANDAAGPFDFGGVSGPAFPGGGPGDADLENELGLLGGTTNDATYIEFDFVPIAPQIQFNFIMASSEYNGPTGTFQCTYEDAFAFILTHIPSGTVSNLAILPTTDTGNNLVSVTNIHPEIPGFGGCPAANEQYFGGYTQASGEIAYDGRTVPLTAFSPVTPGDQYHIKLVVADQGDSAVDTAIFIEGGSFSLGNIDLGDDVFLGDPAALCEGDATILNAGVLPNGTYITWYKDGVEIPGSTQVNPTTGDTEQILEIDVTGDYTAEITFNNTDCSTENTVHIEFYPNPAPDLGVDIIKCAQEEIVLDANVANENDPNMGPLNYEWSYNGNVIQNGPDSTLTIVGTEVLANNTSNSGAVEYLNPITNTTTYTNLVGGVYNLGDFSVVVTDTVTGCNGNSSMNVSFYENANCIDLPTGISPNGDGVNDCVIFDDLEITVGVSKFQVFNRYGTKVFEAGQYLNQWCGTTDDGDKLITGTYYYILEFEDGREPIKSWIYVNRPE